MLLLLTPPPPPTTTTTPPTTTASGALEGCARAGKLLEGDAVEVEPARLPQALRNTRSQVDTSSGGRRGAGCPRRLHKLEGEVAGEGRARHGRLA